MKVTRNVNLCNQTKKTKENEPCCKGNQNVRGNYQH